MPYDTQVADGIRVLLSDRPDVVERKMMGGIVFIAVFMPLAFGAVHPWAYKIGEASAFALLMLWPTWLSYAVSYLFIAIVWTNHHYLMRYAEEATPRLLWFNFAHLFSM